VEAEAVKAVEAVEAVVEAIAAEGGVMEGRTSISEHISRMVNHIHQEAEEKAASIRQRAEEEARILRTTAVQEGMLRIDHEYARKKRQLLVAARIERSNLTRLGRLEALRKRDDEMRKALAAAEAGLPQLVEGAAYGALLRDLVLEGLERLQVCKAYVRSIRGQETAVQAALVEAADEYRKSSSSRGALFAAQVELVFDPNPLEEGIGGVELRDGLGTIRLVNTLKARLDVAFRTNLPQLRAALFR